MSARTDRCIVYNDLFRDILNNIHTDYQYKTKDNKSLENITDWCMKIETHFKGLRHIIEDDLLNLKRNENKAIKEFKQVATKREIKSESEIEIKSIDWDEASKGVPVSEGIVDMSDWVDPKVYNEEKSIPVEKETKETKGIKVTSKNRFNSDDITKWLIEKCYENKSERKGYCVYDRIGCFFCHENGFPTEVIALARSKEEAILKFNNYIIKNFNYEDKTKLYIIEKEIEYIHNRDLNKEYSLDEMGCAIVSSLTSVANDHMYIDEIELI